MNIVVDPELCSTTSSFQNQTSLASQEPATSSKSGAAKAPQRQKRGISAVLQDCTYQPLQKRSSKAKAESTIHEMLSNCSSCSQCSRQTAGSTQSTRRTSGRSLTVLLHCVQFSGEAEMHLTQVQVC